VSAEGPAPPDRTAPPDPLESRPVRRPASISLLRISDSLQRFLHGLLSSSALWMVPATALVVAGVWWAADNADLPSPLSSLNVALLNGAATLLTLGLGVGWAIWGRRWPRLLADLTVVAVACFAAGSLLLILSGTPWGLWGLFGDQAFRNEAVTRFVQHLGSADYAYLGLPAHYPPLVPWLEARAANLVGVPGWHMVKYGEVVLAALVPLLSYALWRRVVAPPVAAAVVTFTTLVVAEYNKIDQWIALALLVPWWLDAFRDARRPDVRRIPAVVHGLIAGVLLTSYTFYFIPMAMATVAGLGLDIARRRAWLSSVLRMAIIVVVGLVVSAWYWWPFLRMRLAGVPFEDFQTRWFAEKHAEVVSPLEISVVGLLAVAGLVYLAAGGFRRRLGEGLLLTVLAGYIVLAGGLVITALGNPILAFKTTAFVVYVSSAAGIVGICHLGRVVGGWAAGRGAAQRVAEVPQRAAAALLTLVCLAAALWFVNNWGQGQTVTFAHARTLPDGTQPTHADELTEEDEEALPYGMMPPLSVDSILALLDTDPDDTPVLVTDRVDLLATTATHPFVTWMSIYSNPFGQFDDRVNFLKELSRTDDPADFAERARDNPYDAIDGFVLTRGGGGWVLRVRVDDFPDGGMMERIVFDLDQFDRTVWDVRRFGDTVVVDAATDGGFG
jgi:galactan 5-O-arabinofuranosyltransferase